MVFKDTHWDLMRGKHFEVFLCCWPVVTNLPASETLQPIRRQDRVSAPITIQAAEGAGPDGIVLLRECCFCWESLIQPFTLATKTNTRINRLSASLAGSAGAFPFFPLWSSSQWRLKMQPKTKLHAIVPVSSGPLNNFICNLASLDAFKEQSHQIVQNHPTYVLNWVLSKWLF